MHITRSTLAILAALSLAAALLACSDDLASGQGGSATTAQSPEDCEDDETYNPVTELCEKANNDESDPSDDNSQDPGVPNGSDNSEDGNNSETNQDEDCGPGALEGQACRPDGASLPSADITVEGVDCDGESFEMTTTTDEDGMYDMDGIPSGQHTLIIESGSFSTQQPVYINNGETTDLSHEAAKVCVGDASVEIALIEGVYDDIGAILDNLNVGYDVVGSDEAPSGTSDAAEFLSDSTELESYDIVFIECGGLWSAFDDDTSVDTTTVMANIQQFIASGNSLYVSDQAHPFIQLSLPDAIDFYNENDQSPQDSWAGASYDQSSPLHADVVSNEMSTVLGMNTVDLTLTIGWAIAEGIGPDSTVHFQGNVDTSGLITLFPETVHNAPLMVTYDDPNSVNGRAIFTSFHNNDQADTVIEEIMEYMIFQL